MKPAGAVSILVKPMKISDETQKMRETLLGQYLTRANGILHLGAHLGHEAAKYQKLDKPVIWVEAIPSVCADLTQKLSVFNNQRAFCALLDREDGLQRTFRISNNHGGVSSSIFDFDDYGNGDHSLWPDLDLKMVSELTLPTIRIDTLLSANNVNSAEFDFWVVDLQGAELLALHGAEQALANCNVMLIEVSEVEVYKGGVLWEELQQWLRTKGFTPIWLPEIPHDDILFVHERIYTRVEADFHSEQYLRHNSRRLEHLASLNLPLRGCRVLELGAGIGDHTSFYLDRDCHVTVSEVRPENLTLLRQKFGNNPNVEVIYLDMEDPKLPSDDYFDVIHCYGLLYHLSKPQEAIKFMSQHGKLLCLETCVSPDDEGKINIIDEPNSVFSQSFYGKGCRPNSNWVLNMLLKYFAYAQITQTQPEHPEFRQGSSSGLFRQVFVAVTS